MPPSPAPQARLTGGDSKRLQPNPEKQVATGSRTPRTSCAWTRRVEQSRAHPVRQHRTLEARTACPTRPGTSSTGRRPGKTTDARPMFRISLHCTLVHVRWTRDERGEGWIALPTFDGAPMQEKQGSLKNK